jgi:hypothetical protein
MPTCDFEVKLTEPDIHVIQGGAYNIDVTLLTIAGICSGSATLKVSGLPSGATAKVFPSSELKLKKGIVATVRIETVGVDLMEEIATSSLTFSASRKGKTRTAKANMTVTLPTSEGNVIRTGTGCDFEVVVSEPDFCVIQGRVYDIDVTLLPVTGDCKGSATLSVSGLPPGVTKKILPSPKIMFTKADGSAVGTPVATVRIDTANMALKEGFATSSLSFLVAKKGLIRKANAEMMVDRSSYDFSLNPHPSIVRVYQEDAGTSSVKVNVKHLGSACERERPVSLSLDTGSLPSFVSYDFSSDRVVPPGETTLSFKASSGKEIGAFKTTLVGCCTDDRKEKTAEIIVDITFPRIPESVLKEEGGPPLSLTERAFRAVPMEEMFKTFNVPPEAQEETRKVQQDLSEKGYIEASESAMEGLQYVRNTLAHPVNQTGIFTFEPASLENTPFKGFKLEGGFYTNEVGAGKFAGLNRILTMPDGAIVMLAEVDYLTSGGGAVYAKEFINENINGFPGRLTIHQSPSGRAITGMSWETATMSYTLEMEGNVKKNGQYSLFLSLAQSIRE